MPAQKLTARKKANLKNLEKANEVLRIQKAARQIEKIRESSDALDKKLADLNKILPDIARDEAIKVIQALPRQNLLETFKDLPFVAHKEAGGLERLLKLLGDGKTKDPDLRRFQDMNFLKLTDRCIDLAKTAMMQKAVSESGPKIQVNIIGRSEDAATVSLTTQAALPPSE